MFTALYYGLEMNKTLLFPLLTIAGLSVLRYKLLALEPVLPQDREDALLFYQIDYSPYCIKVRNILDYKAIPYHSITIVPPFHRNFNLRVSGQLKVPYIQQGKNVICDSTEIALYLESLKPEPELIPSDNVLREEVLLLEDWFDESVLPTFANFTYVHCANHPELLSQDPNLKTGMPFIDKHKAKLMPYILKRQLYRRQLHKGMEQGLEERLLKVLKRLLFLIRGRKYLIGEKISLADVTLASYLKTLERVPSILEKSELRPLFLWQKAIYEELLSKNALQPTNFPKNS